MTRTHGSLIAAAACTAGLLMTTAALAVDPSPLENAYWRFEGGTPGTIVPGGPATVLDSLNANHMRRWVEDFAAPSYTSDVPAAVIPQTGAANTGALSFVPNRDLYSEDAKINHPITSAFTLEAAFRPNRVGSGAWQAIVGKDGKPLGDSPLQTFVLKLRGDSGNLQVEQFDASGAVHSVESTSALLPNQWYYTAIVNDGASLSLYLDRNDGNGYVLQGSTPVSGALFQNDTNWTIGRGMFDGNVTDWYDGLVDEVRLTNQALAPGQFLFVPEPASLLLVAAAGLLGLRRRR